MFSLRSAQFESEKVEKLRLRRMIQSSPKAEVRGSNPFGRASAVLYRHVSPALVQKGFKELQRVFGLGADRNRIVRFTFVFPVYGSAHEGAATSKKFGAEPMPGRDRQRRDRLGNGVQPVLVQPCR
jgi:hypothetical protein